MTCSHCTREIPEYSNYCSFCGGRQRSAILCRRLMLSATDSKIAGVCGGIAEYFEVDSTIVRLIWAVLSVFPGGFIGGVVAYLFAWIIIPKGGQSVTTPASAPTGHAAKT